MDIASSTRTSVLYEVRKANKSRKFPAIAQASLLDNRCGAMQRTIYDSLLAFMCFFSSSHLAENASYEKEKNKELPGFFPPH